jgi:hypothetical protein
MSDKNKENLSEEDYLKKHLGDLDAGKQNQSKPDISFEAVAEPTRVNDLQYFNFDVNKLPCGKFYPKGTLLMVRPAQVREIQAYSMVDDNNFYDIVEKMNGMLQSCVRVKYPDGRIGSYIEIKDQDRLYLIFLIRELTFQQGNSLSVKAICPCDNTETQIELVTKNFVYHEIDEKLDRFFSSSSSCYIFQLKNGREYEITPPNIGIQKAFTDYIIKETNEKRTPNLAFLKIIPFMLAGKTSITIDGIKSKLKEFEEMDDISFQFLNSAVGKMTFGIKEVKKLCECGEEARTDMQFPNGASGIFVIHDAFEAYIKE